MINTKKVIHSSLKVSNNIFDDLLLPVSKRIGFIKGQSPIVPIYFYRYIGMLNNESEYFKKLHQLDEKLNNLDNLYLKFTENIPLTRNVKIVNKTKDIWVKNTSLDNSNRNIIIDDLIKSSALPLLSDSLINSSIENSFSFTLNIYLTTEQNVNLTKIKNFSLKLLTWIYSYIPNLFKNVNYKNSNKEIYNPKIIYYGNIKKHEIYFLIFLSKLGCDVLYINPNSDSEFSKFTHSNSLSKLNKLPKVGEIKKFTPVKTSTPNVTKIKTVTPKVQNTSMNLQNLSLLNTQSAISISYKNSNDPLNDIVNPLTKRSGFLGLPLPLIPTYFYRYIGIKENVDKYRNELYKFNKRLENLGSLYIKFNGNIPLVSNPSLINRTQNIWNKLSKFDADKKELLISLLIEADGFPKFNEDLLDSAVLKGFSTIIDIFLNIEKNINSSKIKNFSLKILTWIHEFVPKLMRNFDYEKKTNTEIFNPKILFYGNIKKHEILFLIFLSRLGCDILYVNSHNDEGFLKIEDSNIYSKSIEFAHREAIQEFPKEEILIREETTAFKASREIETIIHNETDGVYKPWQFENYRTHPKTLKTTFDELKILWNEPARMRSGFKIENKTVYIPNLFAKINGVHNDLNTYWNEIKDFKSSETTLFISKIPFTEVSFRQSDLYTSANLINKEGLIDKNALLSNNIYKFTYLKTPLQDTIIEKINHLLKLSMLKKSIDKEFRLKILKTILSIDKEILKLIQRFDYPAQIPKLVIYDNDENLFNDEDSIIISFLNLMGFDILILTPTGYNNIEQKIKEKFYDIHKLESVKFDLDLPNFNSIIRPTRNSSKSFWSGLFKSK